MWIIAEFSTFVWLQFYLKFPGALANRLDPSNAETALRQDFVTP